jgi:hypothetical protein
MPRDDETTGKEIVPAFPPTLNDTNSGGDGAMFVALIGEDGQVRDVAPIPPEALSGLQETLKTLKAVPKSRRARRTPAFPAITSQHSTPMPGTSSFLVLTGSFSPSVAKQPMLWSEGEGFDLATPTGTLRVQGLTIGENASLQQYVEEELGPERIKELAGLLDVYFLLTHGQEQSENVEVTVKQILQRIGKGDHADDNDEQAHLLNTALYLARTYVVSISSKQTRISPLIVLESVTTDQYGTIHLRYHLGEETFESIYGPKPNIFPLPTPRILGYHGARSPHEIMLYTFLGNRLAQGEGISLYFVTLCIQSGLLRPEKLQPGQKNRMRDAQQMIEGLVQLERDAFIQCDLHPDFHTVVAVNALLEPDYLDTLAEGTKERLKETLRSLGGYQREDLLAKRRAALQRLLDTEHSREDRQKENTVFCTRLTIHPGSQFLTKQQLFLSRHEASTENI